MAPKSGCQKILERPKPMEDIQQTRIDLPGNNNRFKTGFKTPRQDGSIQSKMKDKFLIVLVENEFKKLENMLELDWKSGKNSWTKLKML